MHFFCLFNFLIAAKIRGVKFEGLCGKWRSETLSQFEHHTHIKTKMILYKGSKEAHTSFSVANTSCYLPFLTAFWYPFFLNSFMPLLLFFKLYSRSQLNRNYTVSSLLPLWRTWSLDSFCFWKSHHTKPHLFAFSIPTLAPLLSDTSKCPCLVCTFGLAAKLPDQMLTLHVEVTGFCTHVYLIPSSYYMDPVRLWLWLK